MDKFNLTTPNLTQQNLESLAALFPSCITESADKSGNIKKSVNFSVLKQLLGGSVTDDSHEHYEFTWVGKRQAMAEAAKPTTETLRPDMASSRDWDTTQNLYIEGDNLTVLKILQESYLGKVKMIYIDPPYNTGNDFIYQDDFAVECEEWRVRSEEKDEETGNRMFKNTDSNGRFHSDWCSMIYSRLLLARNLLSDNGIIFLSIDDNEIENLRKMCDEIFGESNYCGTFIINSTPNARDYGHIGKMHESCLFYAKNLSSTETFMLPETDKDFKYADRNGKYNIHPLYNSNEAFHKLNRPNLYYPFYLYLDEPIDEANGFYKIGLEERNHSVKIYPPKSLKNGIQFVWRWGKEKAIHYMNEEIVGYKVGDGEYRIVQKMRHNEKIIRSLLTDTKYSSRRGTAEVEEIFGGKVFSFPKPLSLLHDFCKVGLGENDIVLDFFSGSATTAHAVMQLNAEDGGHRKFIMVQLPEECAKDSEAYKAGYKNICEIGKERIRRAGDKIRAEYEAKKAEAEQLSLTDNNFTPNSSLSTLDIGFRVFRVDSSNMKDVYFVPEEISQMMLGETVSNIKEGRTDLDLLYSCLLDWGVEINLPHTSTQVEGCTVHNVDNGALMACFDENVPTAVVEEMAKQKPLKAVFRDSSFATDADKINVTEIFKNLSPDTKVKVI